MKTGKMLLTFGFCLLSLWFVPAAAMALPITKQPATEIHVSLGDRDGALKFVPEQLLFVAGQRYQLWLDNPSPQKHYFTAKDFADASWTQKLEAGNVEVKGAIHEVELKPEAEAQWVLVPLRSGIYELHCSIPGHAEAGMIGTIIVTD
ncbi:MAG: biphenyl 2,3-dioxygenase [Chloroflexaceae bacterium]|nr:biphenyl 2,3-dioxygenase [Chloroflexaceae bacterium]